MKYINGGLYKRNLLTSKLFSKKNSSILSYVTPKTIHSDLNDPDPTLKPTRAHLTLKNGKKFQGYSFGAKRSKPGEIVFNTGLVGYTEALTDPSYAGQILTLTYPIIGNYGVPDTNARDKYGLLKNVESSRIHTEGIIVQNYTHSYSHWNAVKSLSKWLIEEGVPGIYGIDTRMLTKMIRTEGAILGKIEFEDQPVALDDPNLRNLISQVSIKEPKLFGQGNKLKILCLDCGIKENIIRNLVKRGAEVKVVPWNYNFRNEKYDGLFISNGPGDPTLAVETIANIKHHLENRDEPVFGICMGNQLVGLAAGAKTYKLPFGNRGHNQPTMNVLNGRAYITSQNHGFAIDEKSLPANLKPLFINCNDKTNEGLIHEKKPIFTCQFHPEAFGGPLDSEFLFDSFFRTIHEKHKTVHSILTELEQNQPINHSELTGSQKLPKSVLILGSGGLSIGQAGEFDYSGSQAIKALKEENVKVILINPNIASVQTNIVKVTQDNVNDDEVLKSADTVYFVPVNAEHVVEVIKKEKPEAILLSMGGQTALNCGIELWKAGVFSKYGITVLGTPVQTIIDTEDRKLFKDRLYEINESLAPSFEAYNLEEAIEAAKKINYPVMIRVAYALGGLGSGIVNNEKELTELCGKAFAVAPQVLVEKSLLGWKEVEYEVVRDYTGNCITVCNMENLDPLGIHTGDSIVVAPSQTLSNEEYHMLRRTSINVINHLGIIGECNIQYALNPNSLEYYIIEVNARLSRSSALASKATSYPLAFIATKLSLGLKLTDVKNQATRFTTACFEPSLDYIVTKIPRWDLDRFEYSNNSIDSAMKSIGEVMSIARSFEESFQKALRATHSSIVGFTHQLPMKKAYDVDFDMVKNLTVPNTNRIYVIAKALNDGWSIDKIHRATNIDKWFLHKMKSISDFQKEHNTPIASWDSKELLTAKQLGFSDKQIADMANSNEATVRNQRKKFNIVPIVKQIDTMAAEYPVYTNYLYCTYSATEHDTLGDAGVTVLGCGTYHIGSSVEFDWCAVSTIRNLKKIGKKVIMINHNPETISTDFDEAHKLYFEELSLERVMDIYEHEQSQGIIVSMSGQIPNNLALPLHKNNFRILGTSPIMIDKAEDRQLFSKELDEIGIRQAPWHSVSSVTDALKFAQEVMYPCLLRPSYVLSGSAMHVVYDDEQLIKYLDNATRLSGDHPVVITKFIENAQEVELDAIARSGQMMGCVLTEHLEKAGVHSGDATLIIPTQTISKNAINYIKNAGRLIANKFQITGPYNLQFLVTGDEVLVIECNLRASRSVPFISKSVGADFIEMATKFILNYPVSEKALEKLALIDGPKTFVGVKAPMFSWPRLRGADPVLKCIMSSTGEVASYGRTVEDAYLKALKSTGFRMPQKAVLFGIQESFQPEIVETARLLKKHGFNIYATESTSKYLNENGIETKLASWMSKKVSNNSAVNLIQQRTVDLVINLPNVNTKHVKENYLIRRAAVDYGISCISNLQNAIMFAKALDKEKSIEVETLVNYHKYEEANK